MVLLKTPARKRRKIDASDSKKVKIREIGFDVEEENEENIEDTQPKKRGRAASRVSFYTFFVIFLKISIVE